MICHGCIHFRPVSQKNPISPACGWQPSEEQIAMLRSILPAPVLSRAIVKPAPLDVVECSQFTEA